MRVPPGFRADLAAHEPDLINPVAMTWDDRGRIWVCESIEYPRMDPGPGRDRIRILEDTNGDGRMDRVKTFVDGLNIPSGIAIGYGGVFVANSPDLLFMRDTNGDDRADQVEVLLTGFGRDDTHELPNCLTWGPDGWLYGLNGVFNPSKIVHQGRTHEFTCALWRYHPKTRAFEVYAEGTSNPWGLDYNRQGAWFVSACVIDHLWHLTQTGYYHRQSGQYRPNVWKIESIVGHKHQKAAYCGLAYYDADVYPEQYRGTLLMGNIHGNCINQDRLSRRGSTYWAEPLDDFLSANDAWFMPVSVQVGPDGSLWVLDWYDRYHCYQDAHRDPEGIDRLRGRLYRVVYGKTPMPEPFDLSRRSNPDLVEMLAHPNSWWRRKAQRILVERDATGAIGELQPLALSSAPNNAPMTALWTLISMGQMEAAFHLQVLRHADPAFRAWGVRAAAEMGKVKPEVYEALRRLVADPSPDVRLELAIASSRLQNSSGFELLGGVMSHPDEDPLIPHIVWENLHPRIDSLSGELAEWLVHQPLGGLPIARPVAERAVDLLLPRGGRNMGPFEALLKAGVREGGAESLATACLEALWRAIYNGEIPEAAARRLDDETAASLIALLDGPDGPRIPATALLALRGHAPAVGRARQAAGDPQASSHDRLTSLQALLLVEDETALPAVETLLVSQESLDLKRGVVSAVSRRQDPQIGRLLAGGWPQLPPELQPMVIEMLTSRPAWARELAAAAQAGRIPPAQVNANQLRQMMALDDSELQQGLQAVWGRVRMERDPEREQVIQRMREVLKKGQGDPAAGQRTFRQLCSQCHVMYGYGVDLGPDITHNGRANLEQILSNVLDPNLVIGEGYIPRTVWTYDGQVFNGLLLEDSADRVVLKMAGGQQQIIPQDDIDEMRVSDLSLMPENLEEGLADQDFRDLIAFLLTEQPPRPWSELEEDDARAAAGPSNLPSRGN